jgi:hypothetical protein
MSRADLENGFWTLADNVGHRAILQRIIDEMPATRLSRLVRQIEGERLMRDRTPDDDAVEALIALGERHARAVELLEQAKKDGATGTDELVRAMLAMR